MKDHSAGINSSRHLENVFHVSDLVTASLESHKDVPNGSPATVFPPVLTTNNTGPNQDDAFTIGKSDVTDFGSKSQEYISLPSSESEDSKSTTHSSIDFGNQKGITRTSSMSSSESNLALSKAEFSRRMNMLLNQYNDLPIIKSRRTIPLKHDFSDSPNHVMEMHKPVIFETPEGLDIRFMLGMLTDILSCALCKGLFYNAHTIKECMHTFCKSCLILSTIECGLVCPTCFTPIPTDILEGIEYDHNIQGLVDKIFPRFNEIETEQKRVLDVVMGTSTNDTLNPLQCKYKTGSIDLNNCIYPVLGSTGTIRMLDTTNSFLSIIFKDKANYLNLMENNISCIALIHETDNISTQLLNDRNVHSDRRIDNVESSDISINKYPRKYICVPKNVFIADLTNYLIHALLLESNFKVVIMLKNAVLPKNHSIEFVCKSRRIDMTKCIILRYKVVE